MKSVLSNAFAFRSVPGPKEPHAAYGDTRRINQLVYPSGCRLSHKKSVLHHGSFVEFSTVVVAGMSVHASEIIESGSAVVWDMA